MEFLQKTRPMNEPSQQPDRSRIHVTTNPQVETEYDICDVAPDKEKCQVYLDRLSEAANNIDRRN